MGIQTIKVLRTISKIVLLVFVLGLLGWGGYYVYRSIAFRPQNIAVTNITDSSATITWTTSSQMNGVVYYKKGSSVLPGPLGIIGSRVGYDDRDVSDAQTACVDKFNKNAGETKDENFSVSGENFDCENTRVTGMGKYYTHSVTIKDLDPESTYYFAMGDGIWSFKSDVSSVKTFTLLDEVDTPMPVFGKIVGDDGTYSRDSLVYITFRDGSEEQDSIIYSSTSNDDGGWYVDASAIRDSNGNVLPLELGNDSFRIKGRYSNYGESEEETHVYGIFEVGTFDVTVEKQATTSWFWDLLVHKAYADTCGKIDGVMMCGTMTGSMDSWHKATAADSSTLLASASTLGYGNVLKIIAGSDGVINTAAEIKALNSSNSDGASTLRNEIAYVADKQNISLTTSDVEGSTLVNTSVSCDGGTCVQVREENNGSTTKTSSSDENGEYGSQSITISTKCAYKGGYCEGKTICNSDGTTTNFKYEGCKNQYSAPTCTNGTCYDYQLCVGGELKTVAGSCNIPEIECSSETGLCEDLENGTSRKCISKIYAYYNTSSCFNTPVSTSDSNITDNCSIVASYATIGSHDLDHCSISCENGKSVTVSNSKCLAVSSTVPSTSQTSELSLEILASEIDLSKLNTARIKKLLVESHDLQEIVDDKVLNLEVASEYQPPEICYSSNGSTLWNDFVKYCEALGKNPSKDCDATGEKYSCDASASIRIETPKAYAAEDNSNLYTFFMPEYGLYSFELGDYTVSKQVSDGKTLYLFYIEANGQTGFQMPIDPDNPTSLEDVVLGSDAYEISYKQESAGQQYDLEKGVNLLSFNFVPVSVDSGAYTAEDFINQASSNGVEVTYVSTFDGGRWYEAYSCTSDLCTGTNFTIVPGRGYLIYSNNDGTITIPGYNLTSSVPVAFSSGWNLVGIHGYTTAYTARTLIDSINKIDGLTANNVSWWPTSKGKYEGLQVENSTEYGLDFAISPTNGYFVRVSEFAPSDTKCKSILWNDGGTLNGTCGNTK